MLLRNLKTSGTVQIEAQQTPDDWNETMLKAIGSFNAVGGTVQFEVSTAELATLKDAGVLDDMQRFNLVRVLEQT